MEASGGTTWQAPTTQVVDLYKDRNLFTKMVAASWAFTSLRDVLGRGSVMFFKITSGVTRDLMNQDLLASGLGSRLPMENL